MATDQLNNEFVRRWNEKIWGQQNMDVIDCLVDEEFLGYDLSHPEPVRVSDGVPKVIEVLHSALPDTQVDFWAVVAERDRIAMCIASSGTHKGECVGIEPTGERTEVEAVAAQQTENERHSMRNSSRNVVREVLQTGGPARTQLGVIA